MGRVRMDQQLQQMKQQTNTIFLFVLACLLLATCIGGAFFFSRILNAKISHVVELRQSIATAADPDNVISIKRELDKLASYEEAIDSYFIQANQAVDFIEVVEDLGKVSGVKLEVQDIKIDKLGEATGENPTTHKELNIIVSARGSWSGVTKLLLLFENYPQYLTVTDLRLTASESATGKSQEWTATYRLKGLTH